MLRGHLTRGTVKSLLSNVHMYIVFYIILYTCDIQKNQNCNLVYYINYMNTGEPEIKDKRV